MREIKFRAWDKLNYRFLSMPLVGIDFENDCVNSYEIEQISDTEYKTVQNVCYSYELMQYTGLKDKNGVEIYEGDSVKFIPSGEYGLVTTFGNSQNLGIEWENSRTAFFTPMFYLGCESELEIIGNIYENPELLEGAI